MRDRKIELPYMIEQHADFISEKAFDVSPRDGWKQLLNNMFNELRSINSSVKFIQIKEKFGTLRAYVENPTTDQEYEIITRYESKSATVCYECGEPATHMNRGWITYACEKHSKDNAILLSDLANRNED